MFAKPPPKSDRIGEARAATIRTVKYLCMPMLALLIVIANAWYPVIRFSDERANVAVGAAIWLMPLATAIFALFIPRRWLTTIIVIVLMLPLMLMSALVLFLQSPVVADTFGTGVNPEFKSIARVPMGGYSVAIYLTDYCGAPCSFGIEVLQEKQIIPGLLVVRELPGFDSAVLPIYQVMSKDSLRVDVPQYGEGHNAVPARSRVYCMRPWMYFGRRPTPTDQTEQHTHPIVLVLEGRSLIMPSRECADSVQQAMGKDHAIPNSDPQCSAVMTQAFEFEYDARTPGS